MGIKPPNLQEKDFIHEEPKSPFFSSLLFVAIIAASGILIWLTASWIMVQMESRVLQRPFLNVTNREISLFLWQNPEHMRINANRKTGYLPGFHSINRVTMKADATDDIATAPPDLLFLYHTWDRLIRDQWTPRPIKAKEFQAFLQDAEGWQPQNWTNAPKRYIAYVNRLGDSGQVDLEYLPQEVQKAFQGWKNYHKEGEKINETVPTREELTAFLEQYPHYKRHYWKNIVGENYLKTYTFAKLDPKEKVEIEELAPFLRVAFFNWKMAQNSESTITNPSS